MRLFVALDIPDEVRASLSELTARLAEKLPWRALGAPRRRPRHAEIYRRSSRRSRRSYQQRLAEIRGVAPVDDALRGPRILAQCSGARACSGPASKRGGTCCTGRRRSKQSSNLSAFHAKSAIPAAHHPGAASTRWKALNALRAAATGMAATEFRPHRGQAVLSLSERSENVGRRVYSAGDLSFLGEQPLDRPVRSVRERSSRCIAVAAVPAGSIRAAFAVFQRSVAGRPWLPI